jgi:hypothetical protein
MRKKEGYIWSTMRMSYWQGRVPEGSLLMWNILDDPTYAEHVRETGAVIPVSCSMSVPFLPISFCGYDAAPLSTLVERVMRNLGIKVVRCRGFTFRGDPGGLISVTDDGRAILVHTLRSDGTLEPKTFHDSPDGTAEAHAKQYVLENIDPNAEFYEDLFSDLAIWLLETGAAL